MYSLEQLEKKQIGLRVPQYLISEIDELTQKYAVNRTDIVIEALRSYLQEQKENSAFEQELLSRVSDIENKKVNPLTRTEVFSDI